MRRREEGTAGQSKCLTAFRIRPEMANATEVECLTCSHGKTPCWRHHRVSINCGRTATCRAEERAPPASRGRPYRSQVRRTAFTELLRRRNYTAASPRTSIAHFARMKASLRGSGCRMTTSLHFPAQVITLAPCLSQSTATGDGPAAAQHSAKKWVSGKSTRRPTKIARRLTGPGSHLKRRGRSPIAWQTSGGPPLL
jgi:hypothetical protein